MDLDQNILRREANRGPKLTVYEPPRGKAVATGIGEGVTTTIVITEVPEGSHNPPADPALHAVDPKGRRTAMSERDKAIIEAIVTGCPEAMPPGAAASGLMALARRTRLRFECSCRGELASRPTMHPIGDAIVGESSRPAHEHGCRYEHGAEERGLATRRGNETNHHLAPVRNGIEPAHGDPVTERVRVRSRLGGALVEALRRSGMTTTAPDRHATSWQERILSAVTEMTFAGGRRRGLPAAASVHDLPRLNNRIMNDQDWTPDSMRHGLLFTVAEGTDGQSLVMGRERMAVEGSIRIENAGPADGPFIAAVLLTSKDGGAPTPAEAYLMACTDAKECIPLTHPTERRTIRLASEEVATSAGSAWRIETTLKASHEAGPAMNATTTRDGQPNRKLAISVLSGDTIHATKAAEALNEAPLEQDAERACHETRPGADAALADATFRDAVRLALAKRQPQVITAETTTETADRDHARESSDKHAKDDHERPQARLGAMTPEQYVAILRSIGMQVDENPPQAIHARITAGEPSPALTATIGRAERRWA